MLFFKRIELHGFKSFANKTNLDLLPGITVIVGPNGCGKSNVFDSIRWALGEQSAKSMRGARMGDVIFSGSGSLKATGLARVNLVINNEGHILPTDFDEVSVTRRLFRTGESEYMLNNSICRLRDIMDLFMDTGVGIDSYSIMEQGKVDAIINSKPVERRALFDEAAGISKYKAKKEEALRKLSRTDEDLLRVADIIAEVRRQANSLKRQASKAERYKRMATELRELEMEFLVRRYYSFKESTTEVESLYGQLSAEVERLREELRGTDEQQIAGRASAEDVQRQLEQSQSLHFSVNTELHDTNSQIDLLEQRIASHAERQNDLGVQIAEIEAKVTSLDGETAQLEAEIGSQTENVERLREEYNARKSNYDSLKSDADAAVAESARLRQEINGASRAHMERDNEARMARMMEERTAGELAASDAELGLLRQQLEALTLEREERHIAADEAEQLLAALKKDLETNREAVTVREADCSVAAGELEAIEKERRECQGLHDVIQRAQENFEGYYKGVRAVMGAAKEARLEGIHGVVSTLIEARREHELAIEVALGSQSQDIIVETAAHGKAAIQYLKQLHNGGRATFLPLDLIQDREVPEHVRAAAGEPGVLGFAADLVSFDPRFRPAVQYLLGSTLVVDNIDVALDLERRGVRTKYVTLEGEMVTAHGAMSGGNAPSTNLLHRTREARELAERLGQLALLHADTSLRVQSLQGELASLRETRETLARSVNSQELEAARARMDHDSVEQKAAEKTRQLDQLVSRRVTMEEEIAAQRARQEACAGQLAQLAANLAELEAALDAIESRASAKQQEVASFAGEINDLMIRISTWTERLANLREKLEANGRERTRLVGQQVTRQGEIEQLRMQQQEASGRIAALRTRVGELHERQQEIAGQITIETERKETIHLDLRKLGERSQVLQRDLNEAQNNLHEAGLRRRELSVQLDGIAAQSNEKFLVPIEQTIVHVLKLGQAAPAEASADEASAGDPFEAARALLAATDDTDLRAALAQLREPDSITARVHELREAIETLGPVHVGAIDEYNELNARYENLTKQEKDLVTAKSQLTETITRIDATTTTMFSDAFKEIRANFEQVFRRLFGGGRADLVLVDENGVLDSGIDIVAQPPGKKPTHISLLSGGEKALTAVSLLFAIFMRKPSPFCILDEIDAPLDDANIERFKDLVREFSHTTQFIIITHNKQTMALANTIYGVTMEEQGVSRVISLRLDEIDSSPLVEETVGVGA